MIPPVYVPYTKLFLGEGHSVALAANGHIQVLDSSTGELVHSTAKNADLSENVQKSGEVVAAAVDGEFKYLVTTTSSKVIRVWDIAELSIVSEREAPKKPTDVCLTSDGQTILVSDKFGDVHRYPLRDSQTDNAQGRSGYTGSSDFKATKKRLSDETLLLGHVSLLTTLTLSKDDKYIITADRDEHIRVSWYPEAYTIESYCLGHRKFVSALHKLSWDHSVLVSGGGDPNLKIWNWMEGKLLYEIPIDEAVMPFVKVLRKKPGRSEDRSDAEGQEGDSKTASRGRRRGRKKRRGKEEVELDADSGEEIGNEGNVDEMQIDEQDAAQASARNGIPGSKTKQEPSESSPILAVQKIETFESSPHRFIIFSTHGASALFYCKFPGLTNFSPMEVRSISLEKPVLDFAIWTSENEVWVSIDGNWSEAHPSSQNNVELVKVVKVSNGELVLSDVSTHQYLSNSLNSTSRIEVSQDSLKDIDLYSALVVLPKNVDAERNAMDDEALLSEATAQKLGGKELGRLKTKKAVLALQGTQRGKREQNEHPDVDRTLKGQKSESAAEVE
ncbi:TRM82 [Sanghuangporus weigelae]